MPPPAKASPQVPLPSEPSNNSGADVLVLMASQDEPGKRVRLQECLRQLPGEIHWKLLEGETAVRALSESRSTRVVVCGLALLPEARQTGAAVILLVSPGEEDTAAERLHNIPAGVLIKSGQYDRLLPAVIEQALEAQRYREEFGHYLRHEINNPLTGILVNAELLLDSPEMVSAAGRKRLQTIIDQSIGLRKLIRTIEEKIPLGGPPAEVQWDDTGLS